MVRELPKLNVTRDLLKARIRQKRRRIQGIFARVGISCARALAGAPCTALRAFLEANERTTIGIKPLCALALALELPPLVVAAALRVELPERLRWYLTLQLHGLDALADALFLVEERSTREHDVPHSRLRIAT